LRLPGKTRILKLIRRGGLRTATVEGNRMAPTTAGYDAPEDSIERDYLGRRRVATTIYDLLVNTPQDWSIRVGLFGAWGEGKTSVCKFVEQRANAGGHIVLWFNPWHVNNIGDLWALFARLLIEKLESSGINVEGTGLAKFTDRFRKYEAAVRRISEVNTWTKATLGASIDLMGIFKYDRTLIDRIRGSFPDKRVIVIMDDLDRAQPALMPTLLMSLRELLDLPQFSFLLPFDQSVVSSALAEEHPAWVSGERFLEKITDFRCKLPVPTQEQMRRLFLAELALYCSFVPQNVIPSILDLLPTNPRRLKALVRSIAILKSEIDRHRYSEIDWTLLIIVSMIRVESEIFLDAYLDDMFGGGAAGPNRWLKFGTKSEEKQHGKRVEEIIQDIKTLDSKTGERIQTLCHALRERSKTEASIKLKYHCELLTRAQAVTWSEFDKMLTNCQRFEDIDAWIEIHAKKRDLRADEMLEGLLDAIMMFYDGRLELASQTLTLENYAVQMKLAGHALGLLRSLIHGHIAASPAGARESVINDGTRLKKFIDLAIKWASFVGSETDRSARTSEFSALIEWAEKIETNTIVPLADYLENEPRHLSHEAERERLMSSLSISLKIRLVPLVISKLKEPVGLEEFFDRSRYDAVRNIMFDIDGQIWADSIVSRLSGILETASDNFIVQENAIIWLRLARSVTRRQLINSTIMSAFVKSPQTIPRLWKAATVYQLQFRPCQEIMEFRDIFIAEGAAEAELKIPDWLQA